MKNRKIYCFEPSGTAFRSLCRDTSDKENIECINLGLSDSVCDMTRNHQDCRASIYRNLKHLNIKLDRSEKVKLTTLDTYCESNEIEKIFF